MKEIHRISVIQDLPAVCNDRRNISYLHNSLFHSRSSRGIMQTLQKRDHCNYHRWAPLLWADSYSTGNNYTAQAACRATWMGAFWRKKKGGEGVWRVGGERERKEQSQKEMFQRCWGRWALLLTETAQTASLTSAHFTRGVGQPGEWLTVLPTFWAVLCTALL